MKQEDVPVVGLSFLMGEDGRKLLAVLEGPHAMAPIDVDRVNRVLAGQGFADLFLFPEALDSLVKQYNSGAECTLVIGERRDGAFSVTIDADLMAARLTMTPARGGKPVADDEIYAAVRERGITFGIRCDVIESSVAKGYARNKVIAEGDRPVQGDDAQFISLVRKVTNTRLYSDDEQTVDYRNLGNIVTVKRADPLLRRLPPTDGTPGTNILGLPVAAPAGNDIRFSLLTNGAELHRDDPDLLIAAISGQPFFTANGVTVEPVITIRDVDLSTGNLDIEGTLNITGDVKPGMRVKATADIVIEGMVDAGHIEAGGDVEVRGAIIGHGEPRIDGGMLNPEAAMIRAGGSVRAQFVENAVISSGAEIEIRDFVMNSELNAGNGLRVGEPGSGTGRIINSKCRAASKIEAVTIGSRSGTGTVLEVGADPSIKDRFVVAKQSLHCREREWDEAAKAVEYFRDNPDRSTSDAIREKEQAVGRLQTEIQELTGQLRRLKRRFELLDSAWIKAERQVFSGVRISIGEKTLLLDTDMEGVTFTAGEDGISF